MSEVTKVLDILRKTYPGKGAVELSDPYKVLVATIISQRNRDELTEIVAKRLFKSYPDVKSLASAKAETVAKLIYPAGFYNQKARAIIKTAQIIRDKFAGKIPKTMEELLTLPGVGRKTANCVLAYGYKIPAIVVDTHVFRISQRLGWLVAKNPDEAEKKLEEVVPKNYWLIVNSVIVQHGRAICKPTGPKCEVCPILQFCPFGQNRLKNLQSKLTTLPSLD